MAHNTSSRSSRGAASSDADRLQGRIRELEQRLAALERLSASGGGGGIAASDFVGGAPAPAARRTNAAHPLTRVFGPLGSTFVLDVALPLRGVCKAFDEDAGLLQIACQAPPSGGPLALLTHPQWLLSVPPERYRRVAVAAAALMPGVFTEPDEDGDTAVDACIRADRPDLLLCLMSDVPGLDLHTAYGQHRTGHTLFSLMCERAFRACPTNELYTATAAAAVAAGLAPASAFPSSGTHPYQMPYGSHDWLQQAQQAYLQARDNAKASGQRAIADKWELRRGYAACARALAGRVQPRERVTGYGLDLTNFALACAARLTDVVQAWLPQVDTATVYATGRLGQTERACALSLLLAPEAQGGRRELYHERAPLAGAVTAGAATATPTQQPPRQQRIRHGQQQGALAPQAMQAMAGIMVGGFGASSTSSPLLSLQQLPPSLSSDLSPAQRGDVDNCFRLLAQAGLLRAGEAVTLHGSEVHSTLSLACFAALPDAVERLLAQPGCSAEVVQRPAAAGQRLTPIHCALSDANIEGPSALKREGGRSCAQLLIRSGRLLTPDPAGCCWVVPVVVGTGRFPALIADLLAQPLCTGALLLDSVSEAGPAASTAAAGGHPQGDLFAAQLQAAGAHPAMLQAALGAQGAAQGGWGGAAAAMDAGRAAVAVAGGSGCWALIRLCGLASGEHMHPQTGTVPIAASAGAAADAATSASLQECIRVLCASGKIRPGTVGCSEYSQATGTHLAWVASACVPAALTALLAHPECSEAVMNDEGRQHEDTGVGMGGAGFAPQPMQGAFGQVPGHMQGGVRRPAGAAVGMVFGAGQGQGIRQRQGMGMGVGTPFALACAAATASTLRGARLSPRQRLQAAECARLLAASGKVRPEVVVGGKPQLLHAVEAGLPDTLALLLAHPACTRELLDSQPVRQARGAAVQAQRNAPAVDHGLRIFGGQQQWQPPMPPGQQPSSTSQGTGREDSELRAQACRRLLEEAAARLG